MFLVSTYSSGASDFVGRLCMLEIQHGIQITGSGNSFADFTYTSRYENSTGVCDYVRNM